MRLVFTKMQALGNDFVVLDNRDGSIHFDTRQRRRLADRHFGVGCDQILVVEAASKPDVDFDYRIYNADGAEVEQCGNGARCFSRFVRDKGFTNKKRIRVQTHAGILELICHTDQVTVNMGSPEFLPARIPYQSAHQEPFYHFIWQNQSIRFGAVALGNPHACIQVEDIATAPVEAWGNALQQSDGFPKSVNVGFMQVLDPWHIKLRVFERGVGETLACGSGACAAVAIGRVQQLLDDDVIVDLPGGTLRVKWKSSQSPVVMTGPAEFVFNGQIEL